LWFPPIAGSAGFGRLERFVDGVCPLKLVFVFDANGKNFGIFPKQEFVWPFDWSRPDVLVPWHRPSVESTLNLHSISELASVYALTHTFLILLTV
jgi:hypothetical protein